VHLVGFIIRIYHDARSPERRISASIANLSLFHTVNAGSEAHLIQWIFGYIFGGLQLTGREADHPLLSSAEG
jgi:hypothetical protein